MSILHALSTNDLVLHLARQCEAAGGQSAFARQHDISVSQLSETLSGKREPSERIINALGYARVVRYVEMRSSQNV